MARSLLQVRWWAASRRLRRWSTRCKAGSPRNAASACCALTEADLPAPVADPTEAELTAFYDANAPLFTAPEAKRITYAALLPEMLIDTVQLDEAALREAYDAAHRGIRSARSGVSSNGWSSRPRQMPPPRRRGSTRARRFEALVAERGLALADIDMGEQSGWPISARRAKRSSPWPSLASSGPLPSDLGPALYRMNGDPASRRKSPFEEAREALSAEQADRCRPSRDLGNGSNELDDALAGGATLEDLASETGLKLGTIDYAPGVDAPDRRLRGLPHRC